MNFVEVETANLTGAALDWAVDKCEGNVRPDGGFYACKQGRPIVKYSTDWAQGGPIIERERLELKPTYAGWAGFLGNMHYASGPTPLIAAMRCHVTNKLGGRIAAPSELLN